MPKFEDLPVEVVREILEWVTESHIGKDSLRNLRLVSRNLNTLASPVLFAELNLGFLDAYPEIETAQDCLRCQEIIIALATHSTQVFENTQRLFFRTQNLYSAEGNKREGVAGTKNIVEQKTFDAISALKDLRITQYFYNPEYDPEQLANDVIRALSTLPSFQGFDQLHILHDPPASFTLQPLSNLTILKVSWGWDSPEHLFPEIASLLTRCPNLSDIYLSGGLSFADSVVTAGEIFEKVNKMGNPLKIKSLEIHGVLFTPDDICDLAQHLEHLESLGITRNQTSPKDASSAPGSIYGTLQQRKIYLKRITTDTTSPPLLSYLASYSGLIDLEIFTETEDPRTVDQICEVILPKHRETLENLVLRSRIGGAPLWSTFPTDEQLSGLLQCQRLRVLDVSHGTDRSQLQWDGATVFDRWFQVGFQLPNLEHLKMSADLVPFVDGQALSKMWEEVVQRFENSGVKFRFDGRCSYSI